MKSFMKNLQGLFDGPILETESKDPIWMSATSRKADLINHNSVGEINPVLEYLPDAKAFIMDGGYIGFIMACRPTTGVNNEIRTTFQAILSDEYPPDVLLQFSLAALPRIDSFLNVYKVLRKNRMKGDDGKYADNMSDNCTSFYQNAGKETVDPRSGILPRDFEMWFTFQLPIKELMPDAKELSTLADIKRQIEAALDGIGMSPRLLDDEQWLSRMQTVYNHDKDAGWHDHIEVNRNAPLGGQILEPGNNVAFDTHGIKFEGASGDSKAFAAVMNLSQSPKYLTYGDMINLLGDWEYGKRTPAWNYFIQTLNVKLPSQVKEQAGFNKRASWLNKQAKGKILEWVPSLAEQVGEYKEMKEELKNANLCYCNFSMIVFGKDKVSTLEAAEKLKQRYKRSEYKFNIETILAPAMFINTLPLGLDDNYIQHSQRFELWSTDGASFLIPHSASWKGNTHQPILEFVTRFGQVFSLDLFCTDGSYNALICARSGAGKSFVTNKIVNSYLGSGVTPSNELDDDSIDGAQVFIIDVGRSYENLASQYEDAQFMEFGNDMRFSLDPFASITDFYGKEGQAIMVHSLLKAMASESGNLSDYQSAEMLNILTDLWEEHGTKSSVTMFAQKCAEHSRWEIQQLSAQFQQWCEGGIYGDFFGKKYKPVDFSSRLIVCEMEELSGNPHLSQCVLMCIINAAQHAMFLQGPHIRKLFILDEAWAYLKDKPGKVNYLADFLETGWRRFRKTRAAGICITQSLLDAYQTQVGIAIVNNSPWKLLLEQEKEAIDKLEEMKAYDGTEQDFKLMKSVHTKKGYYSEILVRSGEQSEIVRLFVDGKTQMLYSTDADDRVLLRKYKEAGHDIVAATNLAYQEKLRARA